MDNSWEKLMQDNLEFEKLQKKFIRLDILYEKQKQESSFVKDFVRGDLILIRNEFSLLDEC